MIHFRRCLRALLIWATVHVIRDRMWALIFLHLISIITLSHIHTFFSALSSIRAYTHNINPKLILLHTRLSHSHTTQSLSYANIVSRTGHHTLISTINIIHMVIWIISYWYSVSRFVFESHANYFIHRRWHVIALRWTQYEHYTRGPKTRREIEVESLSEVV